MPTHARQLWSIRHCPPSGSRAQRGAHDVQRTGSLSRPLSAIPLSAAWSGRYWGSKTDATTAHAATAPASNHVACAGVSRLPPRTFSAIPAIMAASRPAGLSAPACLPSQSGAVGGVPAANALPIVRCSPFAEPSEWHGSCSTARRSAVGSSPWQRLRCCQRRQRRRGTAAIPGEPCLAPAVPGGRRMSPRPPPETPSCSLLATAAG
jgi:hypothetical protein